MKNLTASLNKHPLIASSNKKVSSQRNRDSFETLPYKNVTSSKPIPIYIHQFNKIISNESSNLRDDGPHQSMYEHEDSNLQSHVDVMNKTNNRANKNFPGNPKLYSSFNFVKRKQECSVFAKSDSANSGTTMRSGQNKKSKKSKLFHLDNKVAIDKLEESYWAKWKPKQHNTHKINNKTKPVQEYPINKPKAHPRFIKKNLREKGDSNDTIIAHYQQMKKSTETSTKDNPLVEKTSQKEYNEETKEEKQDDDKQEDEQKDNLPPLILSKETGKELRLLDSLLTTITPHLPQKDIDNSDEVRPIKHTDSFILQSRKQKDDKPHFQQPKCIRLFKNTTNGSYVRGGTYTLKSCLKKEKPAPKSNVQLGRPGSPMKITIKNKKQI